MRGWLYAAMAVAAVGALGQPAPKRYHNLERLQHLKDINVRFSWSISGRAPARDVFNDFSWPFKDEIFLAAALADKPVRAEAEDVTMRAFLERVASDAGGEVLYRCDGTHLEAKPDSLVPASRPHELSTDKPVSAGDLADMLTDAFGVSVFASRAIEKQLVFCLLPNATLKEQLDVVCGLLMAEPKQIDEGWMLFPKSDFAVQFGGQDMCSLLDLLAESAQDDPKLLDAVKALRVDVDKHNQQLAGAADFLKGKTFSMSMSEENGRCRYGLGLSWNTNSNENGRHSSSAGTYGWGYSGPKEKRK